MNNDIKLTLSQVAEITGFCYQKIWNDVKAEKLRAAKIGRNWRVKQADLQSYIDGGNKNEF